MAPLMALELRKYEIIIQMAKHINSQRAGGHPIAHLLPQLSGLLNGCHFTNPSNTAMMGVPLAASVSMFSQNLAQHLYDGEITKAEAFHAAEVAKNNKALAGQYVKNLKDFNQEAMVRAILPLYGTNLVDYVVVGLDVHVYDINPSIFTAIKTFLDPL